MAAMQTPDAPQEAYVWRVASASVAGTNHERTATPCQDAHRWDILPMGVLVVTVADGAGSASRSDEGANIAVVAAITDLTRALNGGAVMDDALMQDAFKAARVAVTSHAESLGGTVRDFATTLTCVVATDGALLVGQIGDGLAIAKEANDSMFVAIKPQRGEYANEVHLLTMPDALNHVEIAFSTQAAYALAVTTDGLLRLAVRLPSCEPHEPFLHPLFAFVAESVDVEQSREDLVAFLMSDRVSARTDDDKTLVLAVRVKGDTDIAASATRGDDAGIPDERST